MANRDTPFGLRPAYHLLGGDANRTNAYTIAAAYGTKIYTGDLVTKTATGNEIGQGAASDTLFTGVFAGCRYKTAGGEIVYSRYWPADVTTHTEIVAWVYDDPFIVFEIQADGDIEAADYGNQGDLIITHAGVDSTGVSGMELKSSDIDTGSNLKILGLVPRVGNAVGTNAKIYVLISEHEYRSGALTKV